MIKIYVYLVAGIMKPNLAGEHTQGSSSAPHVIIQPKAFVSTRAGFTAQLILLLKQTELM